ncbi:MAG: MFS transporter [Bacteroidota bacterium]|nr:MFS transporter [Bacteroidota bacterium]
MMNVSKKNSLFASVPVFLAFLCMGFGDVAGTLTDLVKNEYELSNFMAGFIPFSGFIMFGILSVPFALIMARKSKKLILSIGLFIAFLGLIIPTFFGFSLFVVILLSILLLGAGAALLQVAGNPIMKDVSPQGKYSRNLSFGQFVKAIGSLSGALIPAAAAIWWGLDWKVLFPIYSATLAISFILLIFSKINEEKTGENLPTFASCFRLLGENKNIALIVLGIFVYVGAEVSMASKLPSYLETNFGLKIEELGVASVGLFFLSIMTGRFLGGLILNWIKARTFLIISALLSLIGIAGLFLGIQSVAIISIVIIGLGFANVFPLVFSMTVEKYPEQTNELSGLMVTAIVGGAIVPIITGLVADQISITMSFIVPAIALLYVLYLGLKQFKLSV